jgi:hypothetical protein
MYSTSFSEVISILENLEFKDCASFLLIAKRANPIETLLIQPLKREYNGEVIDFLSLRNIVVSSDAQKTGVCSRILSILESKNYPIMIDDIINPNFDKMLDKRHYKTFFYNKNEFNIKTRIINIK